MKVSTTLKPRTDGVVLAEFKVAGRDDPVVYKFAPDEHGDLVCEIADEAVLKHLLRMPDRFMPTDEADDVTAAALLEKDSMDRNRAKRMERLARAAVAGDEDDDGDGDDDGQAEQDDDVPAPAPLEANTPPKPGQDRRGAPRAPRAPRRTMSAG